MQPELPAEVTISYFQVVIFKGYSRPRQLSVFGNDDSHTANVERGAEVKKKTVLFHKRKCILQPVAFMHDFFVQNKSLGNKR